VIEHTDGRYAGGSNGYPVDDQIIDLRSSRPIVFPSDDTPKSNLVEVDTPQADYSVPQSFEVAPRSSSLDGVQVEAANNKEKTSPALNDMPDKPVASLTLDKTGSPVVSARDPKYVRFPPFDRRR
jgi:hypothetical protein